jgi:hypothetical protein
MDEWFSGCSSHSETNGAPSTEASPAATPLSVAGEGAWGEDVELRFAALSRSGAGGGVGGTSTRASPVSVRRSVGAAESVGVAGGGDRNSKECVFKEFNCKVTVDDFEILHMIGEGGFGKVYQVRQRNRANSTENKNSGRILAMKCMRKESVLQDNLKGMCL